MQQWKCSWEMGLKKGVQSGAEQVIVRERNLQSDTPSLGWSYFGLSAKCPNAKRELFLSRGKCAGVCYPGLWTLHMMERASEGHMTLLRRRPWLRRTSEKSRRLAWSSALFPSAPSLAEGRGVSHSNRYNTGLCHCPCSGTILHFLWGSTAPSLPGRSGVPHCNMGQEKTLLAISKWVTLLTGNLSKVKTIVQNVSVLVNQLLPRGKAEPFEEHWPVIQHKPSPRDLAIKAWDKLQQADKINPGFTGTN